MHKILTTLVSTGAAGLGYLHVFTINKVLLELNAGRTLKMFFAAVLRIADVVSAFAVGAEQLAPKLEGRAPALLADNSKATDVNPGSTGRGLGMVRP
jgi:hypothetical protein